MSVARRLQYLSVIGWREIIWRRTKIHSLSHCGFTWNGRRYMDGKSSTSLMEMRAWPSNCVTFFLISGSCDHGLSSNARCFADTVGKRWQWSQKHILNRMTFGPMHQANSPISYKQETEMTVSQSDNRYRELLCWQVKSSRSSYFHMTAFIFT